MHARPEDNVRLIEVPFARLAQPILLRLLSNEPKNARQVINEQEKRERDELRLRCKRVAEGVTATQLKVLRAFARGLDPQDVAKELDRDIKTINSHTTVLLKETRIVWEIDTQKHLSYHFLQKMFAEYFSN